LQSALVAVRVAEQGQGPGVKVQAPGIQLSCREPGRLGLAVTGPQPLAEREQSSSWKVAPPVVALVKV
jgi:hypothetical protein